MNLAISISVFAVAVGIIMTLMWRSIGLRFKIVDLPDNYRKIHSEAIPLSGGYSLISTLAIVLLAGFLFVPNINLTEHHNDILILLIGAVLSIAMGGYDDIRDLGPKTKLLLQVGIATLCYFGGFSIEKFTIPLLGPTDIGMISYPVTIFWYLGCMNAINLLDGLDGLCAGIGLFAFITLLIYSVLHGNDFNILINAIMVGSLIAFLFFNFNPASIFLGDAGSLFIGYMVASMALLGSAKAETVLTIAITFVAIGLPVFDTVAAILRRWSHRVPVSSADRKHIHHTLLKAGFSQRRVVLILYAICVAFAFVSFLLIVGREPIAITLLFALLTLSYVFCSVSGIINLKKIRSRLSEDHLEKQRSNSAAIEVERAVSLFAKCDTTDELWGLLTETMSALELDHAILKFDEKCKCSDLFWFGKGYNEMDPIQDEFNITMKLYRNEMVIGKLIVRQKGHQPLRDMYFLMSKLRDALCTHLYRILKEKQKEDPLKQTG
ncbi:MAG: undecaprenyl/decaprenyl-phosphate alpha-N-acetylglucosaminyl 1-phosphate transferase [Lentisphaeria bacterium]|nr:undecaprenyl/decaprenyl-phosphate alpha-N-acetylglucosaminyl 1-phosphate transferase [Lentisphaeria bacterium]NQZ66943.1 undecaprenyl/decaprenyl-phosphate alpha-N-acetylglucosaminyl 1-phosphate transferase [Lentisphaeria bacterium]